ncbi:HNH endonuclease family protein [Actinoallomurus rhizosphaericola]|uniref:HNH endonuclease family protein n=1 Tax=Actinoallomurus rhizosphaericola TaxID=2952536 RepID=UPI00209224C2|nr:DUF1524 domain-containing protein [Actinoallomurus rhizosphaericola]MCO5998644.1 HNH endonuclease family protein [Actinoallomurus rhizosphaericola]
MRRAIAVTALLPALPLLTVVLATPASAAPPSPPSTATAKKELARLKVRREGTLSGYSRAKFPQWIDQGHGCNTREVVLKRDGAHVRVGSDCYPVTGRWYSPYDGKYLTNPHKVDIEHLVALAEAWRSGAKSWSTAKRRAFANDLKHPELWTADDPVNRQKGGKDPARWLPPRHAFRCTYIRAYVRVKYVWGLSVDSAEKKAIAAVLKKC